MEETKDIDEGKLMAVIAYFLLIVGAGIVYFTDYRKNNFSMYHARQSLVLFIAWVVVYIVGKVVPVLGELIILPIGTIFLVILWIVGMINAFEGRQKPLPVIGEYGEKLEL